MAGIFSTAGSKLYIGQIKQPQSAEFVEADFASQSWLEVGWTENLGTFGDMSQTVSFDAIGENRTQKLKGTRNAGQQQVVCGLNYSDLGQIALRSAEADPNNFAFKIEFNDAPSGGTPSLRYYVAQVMSASETLDTANNVMKLNTTLEINSNIVRVNAAP